MYCPAGLCPFNNHIDHPIYKKFNPGT